MIGHYGPLLMLYSVDTSFYYVNYQVLYNVLLFTKHPNCTIQISNKLNLSHI